MSTWESTSLRTKFQGINKVKVLLNLILILIVFIACYVENIYLFFHVPQPGETSLITFRAQSSFEFNQAKAFKDLRDGAITQYSPIYVYLPDRAAAAKKKMEDFIGEVFRFRSQGKAGRGALIGYLKKEFGVEISSKDAVRLLRYPDPKNLLAGILTIQDSISQGKIVEDPTLLKGKKTVRVLYPAPIGINAFSTTEVTTLAQARRELQERIRQVFWQVDSNILDPVLQVSLATLQPNLRYDKKSNDIEIEAITRHYPSQVVMYKPDEVLVPFRNVLSTRDVLLLAAASQATGRKFAYGGAPWVLFVICFSVLLYNVLLSKIYSPCWRTEPPYQLFLTVLILTVLILKACLLFTPLPVYVVPFVILPLLLILLHRERISLTFTTILGALLVSLFAGRNLTIFFYLVFGGLAAILTSFRVRKRSHIFIPALVVGTTNAAVVFFWLSGSSGLDLTSWHENFALLGIMGWAFVGGLIAGPLVLFLMPVLEWSRHYASAFRLTKFSDLQHPLMIELLTKAPGTYQHAMTVAHLAYALGEAIGANSLLLRVAAYYHDIGKTANPDFYVENLFGRKSPHDALPARESTRIIMDHVRNGKKIALQEGLPEVVAEFIPQHHGTLLIEYFYDKAVKENPGAVISQKDFRYSGPKPQSVEAAILMIVDAVEATSRTIEEPTREKIEAMIRHIIENRISDGQFDECNLSTSEIAKIVNVLIRSLEASFHTRVEYPWQQKEKKVAQIDKIKKDAG
jgi:putative nucleotidyltransferase with HDIG domain